MAKSFYLWQTISKRPNANHDLDFREKTAVQFHQHYFTHSVQNYGSKLYVFFQCLPLVKPCLPKKSFYIRARKKVEENLSEIYPT